MKRNLITKLIEWKNSPERKPLILDGARQVGKTWLLQEFGRQEFKNTIYLNCDGNSKAEELFASDYNVKRIIRDLDALFNQEIDADSTLIIFDEIQQIPSALPSLKYFCEDARQYHVVAAGSLLGLNLHKGSSFPVGKVDILKLYPLSFDEFARAAAGEELYKTLTQSPIEELNSLHSKFVELLREYYFTGGMPEAVNAFVQGKSVHDVRSIQKSILYAYEKDISKHAPERIIQKIHQVWESIPQQLAKVNRKFIYGAVKKGARAKDFEEAIQWLVDSGLVYKVNRVKKPNIPLKFYEDFDSFKLFILDCGLLGAISDTPIDQILVGDNIFEEYKGAFTEQYAMQQLKTIPDCSIYYFSAEDSKQELDFLLQKESKIIPIEVKAEENLRSKSLHQFLIDNPQTKGVRFSMSKFREQDWMTNIPLYAASVYLK
ncbi:MAG: AAA family ATPase [Treponema sp.]